MNRGTFFLTVAALLCLVLVGSFVGTIPVRANSSFTVDSTADAVDANPGNGVCATVEGACTLRAAIQEANALEGEDTISLPAGIYILTINGRDEDNAATGDLDLAGGLTITGAGAATTVIDANGIDRVLHLVPPFLATGVAITNVSISRGDPGGNSDGGGIYKPAGSLNVVNTIISSNHARHGGGVWILGGLTVGTSTISGNSADVGGGGIAIAGGPDTPVSIISSTISGNSADNNGGGIEVSSGLVTILNSTISGNNSATGGGLVNFPSGAIVLRNSTISDNHASVSGGGLHNSSETFVLANSIIAGNTSASAEPDCVGELTSQGYNLLGNAAGCTGLIHGTNGDRAGTSEAPLDPLLGPLEDNGGPTETHALLPGSPAIDGGNPAGCTDQDGNPFVTDQRGAARPVDGDGDSVAVCDIGAFEVQETPPTPTAISLPPTPTETPLPPTPTETPLPPPTPESSVFVDPIGDSGSAPDITTVEVSFEPLAETFTLVVNFANQPSLAPGSNIQLYFDADRDPSTGSIGNDRLIVFRDDGSSILLRFTGSSVEQIPAPSLVASYLEGRLRVIVGASDLGTTDGFFFLLRGCDCSGPSPKFDSAPDDPAKWIFFVEGPPVSGTVTIRGRVVDAETGQPLPGDSTPFVSVNLFACPLASCSEFVAALSTDSEGMFRLAVDGEGMPLQAGIYQVRVFANLYQSTRFGPFQANGGEELDVGDIPLSRELLADSITGRIVDLVSGSPLPGDGAPFATVELRDCSTMDCFTSAGPYPVGSDGSFRFDSSNSTLLLGAYEILVRAEGHEPFLSDRFDLIEDEVKAFGVIALAPIQPSGPWYVANDGDDANPCDTVELPCRTINGALAKAHFGDTVYVAFGDYRGTGNEVVLLNKGGVLSGGWDRATFTQQFEPSVIDGERMRRGITNLFTATVDNFFVRGASAGLQGGAGIYNSGDLTLIRSFIAGNSDGIFNAGGDLTVIESEVSLNSDNGIESFQPSGLHNVTLVDSNLRTNGARGFHGINSGLEMTGGSIAGNFDGGLFIIGPFRLTDVTITGNQTNGDGGGILASNVVLASLTNVTISSNASNRDGGGIHFWGIGDGRINLTNVTISGNSATRNGGGIMAASGPTTSMVLSNLTLVGNNAAAGGGIFAVSTVTLRNSILADNAEDNCGGDNPVTSAGYNLDSGSSCGFTSSGDQVNTDPQLGPLDVNGGPTVTQALLAGSPAIDAGNPVGCTDQEGNLLATDQRGAVRPFDGNGDGVAVCDIGAFEFSPVIPGDQWYVATTGDDENDCRSPSTPCATIQGALQKAGSGDTVLVASGTYTGIEPVIVEIGRNAILSGGWDPTFSQQSGYSVIDGEFSRRGITIFRSIAARIERFVVQNGGSPFGGVGGISNLGTLTLRQTIVAGNSGGPGFGAILNSGTLTANESVISGNTSGISNSGDLSLLGTTISYNSGPGITNNGGTVSLLDTTLLQNAGSGIQTSEGSLTINRSTIQANGAQGIFSFGGEMTLNETVILENGFGGIESFQPFGTREVILFSSEVLNNGGRGIRGTNIDLQVTDSDISGNSDGGIFNMGPTALAEVTVSDNHTTSDGGGVYLTNIVTASLTNVMISGNSAEGSGGGLYFWGLTGGAINLADVIIIGNSAGVNGGGIIVDSGTGSTMNLENTIVAGNSTIEEFGGTGTGGGIYNKGTLTLNNTTVRNNRSANGGGISTTGVLTLHESTVSSNFAESTSPDITSGTGAGIWNVNGTLTIDSSTISGNRAGFVGGGIADDSGTTVITNSTISGNDGEVGGGIRTGLSLILRNASIANNGGGGIASIGIVTVQNSLIAGNLGLDCAGSLTSEGHNIFGTSCPFSPGDLTDVDPLIGPLQDNGGPTLTHAFLPGSPAIDGGNPAGCTDQDGNPLVTDQRGELRPVDGNGDGVAVCDIGAFEAQQVLPAWFVNRIQGSDDNDCESRGTSCRTINAALAKASSGDTVFVTMGTYTGSSSEVVLIEKDVILSGGWDLLFGRQIGTSIIDGQGSRRGVGVNEGVVASIDRFWIRNGSSLFGAGIYNAGILDFTNGELSFNVSGGNFAGGGILNVGTLSLFRSLVAANTGDGIFNDDGILNIRRSSIGGNSEAGINSVHPSELRTVTLREFSITNNGGRGFYGVNADLTMSFGSVFGNLGGGISNQGTMSLTDLDVFGNHSPGDGGGIAGININSATFVELSISGNSAAGSGGGLFFSGLQGEVNLSNIAVTGNTADLDGGGIILASGTSSTVNLTNVTVSGNSAVANGGGVVASDGNVNLNNATITHNTADIDGDGNGEGGGIYSTGTVTLQNTILFGNADLTSDPDCFGTLTSAGYNLVGVISSGCTIGGDTTGDIPGMDPLLGPLQLNSGRTQTHALLPGSPAIDAGNPGGCTDHEGSPILTDQRGEPRPFDGDGDGMAVCDIGAFEVQQGPPTPTPSPTETPTPTDTPTPTATDTPIPTDTPTATATFTPTSTPVTGPVCQGLAATVFANRDGEIVGGPLDGQHYEGRLIGTDGDDVIAGTGARDRILARGGDDLVCGQAGSDRIFGGDGRDSLLGGNGDDRLLGGDGADMLRGGEGDDALHGNEGNDVLRSGDGKDSLFGGDDNDVLTGGAGADFFSGGQGNDRATDFNREKGDRKDGTVEFR